MPGSHDPNADPRVAILQPRFDSQGGAEKYAAYVAETLSAHVPVDAVTEHEVDVARLRRAFNVELPRVRFICDPRVSPTIRSGTRLTEAVGRRRAAAGYAALTRQYDVIIGVTQLAPWRSNARRSVLLVHFPVVRGQVLRREIPQGGPAALLTGAGREQRDLRRRLASWDRIVCNSEFTQRHIRLYWGREAEIIHPPIELPETPDLHAKQNWILAAGFFSKPGPPDPPGWSYKRQELLISEFKRLCDAGLRGWELHLAGHVLPPDAETAGYVESLRRSCGEYPIQFHPDCPHSELQALYRQAAVFWHAAGYGVDPALAPERTEHFGMVTAEAMGWGCVPVVVNLGGQPEIVEHRRSGLLWDSLDDFRRRTMEVIESDALRGRLAEGAVQRARGFGLDRFRRQWTELLEGELAGIAA